MSPTSLFAPPPIDEVRSFSVFGKQYSIEKLKLKRIFYGGITSLAVFHIIAWPFALPKLRRFIGAPFVPIVLSRARYMSGSLLSPSLWPRGPGGRRMLDIGSGDGRVVIEAAKTGMYATGIEVNPWMVMISRVKAWNAGVSHRTSFKCVNMWNVDWSTMGLNGGPPDLVFFYGRPGDDVMSAAASKMQADLPEGTLVVSNHFDLPLENLVKVDNDFRVYEL